MYTYKMKAKLYEKFFKKLCDVFSQLFLASFKIKVFSQKKEVLHLQCKYWVQREFIFSRKNEGLCDAHLLKCIPFFERGFWKWEIS